MNIFLIFLLPFVSFEPLKFTDFLIVLFAGAAYSIAVTLYYKAVQYDEISRIKDWQRAIKSMKDSGELANSCLVLTGSHTLDIKHGIELLPGRTGKFGKDLMLLPLSFSEYVKLVNPKIAEKSGFIVKD